MSGRRTIIRNQSVSVSSTNSPVTVSRQSSATPLKKSRKRAHYSSTAVSTYVGAFLLIVTLVAVGYQPTKRTDVSMVSNTPDVSTPSSIRPSIDEVVAVAVAGGIAERANLPIASNAAELSVALAVKNELAQTGSGENMTITKPQIVEPDTSSRKIKTHVAQKGDTVRSVALQYGVSATTVKWANDLTSEKLEKGKKLTIPPSDGVVYTVKDGDTVNSLAKKYSADETRIVTFNDLEISGLKKGQKILIPSGSLPSTERPGYVAPPSTSFASSGSSGTSSPSSSVTANFMAGSVGNKYAYGYCTWYAYERRADSGRPVGSFWGNAYSWASAARSQGYKVNNTPAAGAVMQSSSGGGGYGHVAYVESVDGKGNVTVREMNYAGWNVISSRTISAGQARNYSYIH